MHQPPNYPWSRDSFERYCVENPLGLEVVTWYMYHTKRFNDPHYMEFFQETSWSGGINDTNIWMPAMLPNPMAFLIHGVRIMGLTTEMLGAHAKLIIGNKIYTDFPAWVFTVNHNRLWKPAPKNIPLMIPPLVNFRFELQWNIPVYPSPCPDITVCFRGDLARASC